MVLLSVFALTLTFGFIVELLEVNKVGLFKDEFICLSGAIFLLLLSISLLDIIKLDWYLLLKSGLVLLLSMWISDSIFGPRRSGILWPTLPVWFCTSGNEMSMLWSILLFLNEVSFVNVLLFANLLKSKLTSTPETPLSSNEELPSQLIPFMFKFSDFELNW